MFRRFTRRFIALQVVQASHGLHQTSKKLQRSKISGICRQHHHQIGFSSIKKSNNSNHVMGFHRFPARLNEATNITRRTLTMKIPGFDRAQASWLTDERITALILMAVTGAVTAGIWSELKTRQMSTWVTRAYDSFIILNKVGMLKIVTNAKTDESIQAKEAAEESNADDHVENEKQKQDEDSKNGHEKSAHQQPKEANEPPQLDQEAVAIWKILLEDTATRNAGEIIPWDVIRAHPYISKLKNDIECDIADIFTELIDPDGVGVPLQEFITTCGVLHILSRDLHETSDKTVQAGIATLLLLQDGKSTVEQAVFAGRLDDSFELAGIEQAHIPLNLVHSYLRAMAVLGVVKAQEFLESGTTLAPDTVACKILKAVASNTEDSDLAPEKDVEMRQHGITGAVFTSDIILQFMDLDMFRKRNDVKYTGHSLLKEYNRRQRFLYGMPDQANDTNGHDGTTDTSLHTECNNSNATSNSVSESD